VGDDRLHRAVRWSLVARFDDASGAKLGRPAWNRPLPPPTPAASTCC
jgi:hypothetical protein